MTDAYDPESDPDLSFETVDDIPGTPDGFECDAIHDTMEGRVYLPASLVLSVEGVSPKMTVEHVLFVAGMSDSDFRTIEHRGEVFLPTTFLKTCPGMAETCIRIDDRVRGLG